MAELIQKNLLCLPTITLHSKAEELMMSPSTSFLMIKSKNYCIFLFMLKNHVEKTSENIGPGHTKQNTLNMGHISPQKNNSKKLKPCQAATWHKTREENPLLLWVPAALRTRQESHHRSTPVKTWQGSAKRETCSCWHTFKTRSNLNFYRPNGTKKPF